MSGSNWYSTLICSHVEQRESRVWKGERELEYRMWVNSFTRLCMFERLCIALWSIGYNYSRTSVDIDGTLEFPLLNVATYQGQVSVGAWYNPSVSGETNNRWIMSGSNWYSNLICSHVEQWESRVWKRRERELEYRMWVNSFTRLYIFERLCIALWSMGYNYYSVC